MRTFSEVIEQLSDGSGYAFWSKGLMGYFYKAPYPSRQRDTERDGALSAITYWIDGKQDTPVLMLYDLDESEASWVIVYCNDPTAFNKAPHKNVI